MNWGLANWGEDTTVWSLTVSAGDGVPGALRSLADQLEAEENAALIGVWNCGDGAMCEPHETVLQAVVTFDRESGPA